MKHRSAKYRHAETAFHRVKSKHRMSVFQQLKHFPPTEEEIDLCVSRCALNGIACVFPRLPASVVPGADVIPQAGAMYASLVKAARRAGIKVGFYLEPVLEQSYFLSLPEAQADALRSQSLIRREYYCDPHEVLHMPLHGGTLMSLMAYDDEHTDMMDLRDYIKDGYLDFTVPAGNWTVEEYICTSLPLAGEERMMSCNRLSASAGMTFLRGLFDALDLTALGEPGGQIGTLYVSDLSFHAPNRRNWDPEFNRLFSIRFGFDPAPFYPALYHDIGEQGPHLKSLLMDCRAEMLRSGYLCALKAFADRNNMRLIASGAEPQLPACSWLSGDALANQVFSPCAVQERSYLYGMNSTHLAASAADNYGSKFVACELFRDYARVDARIAYKDTLNAFGHGANLIMAHADTGRPMFNRTLVDRLHMKLTGTNGRYTYSEFVARIQALLRGGSRVNDMAMLYPIYALHDKVYLYEAPTGGKFEYPNTPFTCNYMTLLSSLSTYAGQDITILHPHVLSENCRVEDGALILTSPYQTQRFSILILPGADMISLSNIRMIRDFYDRGGKVLAAGALPRYAFEFGATDLTNGRDPDDFMRTEAYGTPADREVRAIVRHIFGEEALSSHIIRDSFCHTNDRGGMAYYFSTNQTSADGTEMTDCASLYRALRTFPVPLDVYMPNMPRFESYGALSTTYNDFSRLGLVEYIPGGGMISHIHKRRHEDQLDIFFFANTTDRTYDEYIYLRGIYVPSRWDPHTGLTRRLRVRYMRLGDEIYTRVRLYLFQDHAAFLVSDPHPQAARIQATRHTLPDMLTEL